MRLNFGELVKKIIKVPFNRFGYDVVRLNQYGDFSRILVKLLNLHRIDHVIDVGANIGQFASNLRNAGYSGKIISFEPLQEVHASLQTIASDDPNWQIAERCALGNKEMMRYINVSKNSVSSSLLDITPQHMNSEKSSSYVGRQKVQVKKLDNLIDAYVPKNKKTLLKIDTQGFEWEVLNGALKSLERIDIILCEVSLFKLYQKQKLWIDVIKFIENNGFTVWNLSPAFIDQNLNQLLQVDLICVKLQAKNSKK